MDSRFLSRATAAMKPYVPGEQPQNRQCIKLNTNESPYPPSPLVQKALAEQDYAELRLYPDPDSRKLNEALVTFNRLQPGQALATGGSDEALAFAFMTFFDRGDKVYFADVTYGFYRVYADLFGLETVEIPVREDFSINVEDYFGLDGNIFIANPNAPTGMTLPKEQIEEILRRNPDRLVVVDEAYADFAPGTSCMGLIDRYENLLIIQTFSKSRALAGMRLGAAYGQAPLIDGMNRIRYSFNPYNLDQISIRVGLAAVADYDYCMEIVGKVIKTRERVGARLRELGYTVLPSDTNFLFIAHPTLGGAELHEGLKAQNILARYFPKKRIDRFLRLTIGSDADMDTFLRVAEELR